MEILWQLTLQVSYSSPNDGLTQTCSLQDLQAGLEDTVTTSLKGSLAAKLEVRGISVRQKFLGDIAVHIFRKGAELTRITIPTDHISFNAFTSSVTHHLDFHFENQPGHFLPQFTRITPSA